MGRRLPNYDTPGKRWKHYSNRAGLVRPKNLDCVVIQASGSMVSLGRREAMFEAAQSFAPCDLYANDEGTILYCGRLETNGYGHSSVMMPMTGTEDTDPTFHLIGFAMDYDQVIFIDDGDNTIGIINDCKKAARRLGIISKLAPIKGVFVRDFRIGYKHEVDRHTEAAEKLGIEVAFFNERRGGHGDYPRGFVNDKTFLVP